MRSSSRISEKLGTYAPHRVHWNASVKMLFYTRYNQPNSARWLLLKNHIIDSPACMDQRGADCNGLHNAREQIKENLYFLNVLEN